jgi:hypothetical protein
MLVAQDLSLFINLVMTNLILFSVQDVGSIVLGPRFNLP